MTEMVHRLCMGRYETIEESTIYVQGRRKCLDWTESKEDRAGWHVVKSLDPNSGHDCIERDRANRTRVREAVEEWTPEDSQELERTGRRG